MGAETRPTKTMNKPVIEANNGERQRALSPATCSAARPITPEDVIKEADRNYDLGRKHGLEEARPSLAATQRLLLEIAIEQRQHQEWRTLAMRMADESTAVLDNAHWEVKHGSGDLLTTIKAVREKYRLETQLPPNVDLSQRHGQKPADSERKNDDEK